VKKIKSIIIISLLFLTSCEKELLITEFSEDFSNYEPELRIEALILPTEKTAIVRVDRSVLITDTSLYDCIDNDGDWNPLIHDVGIDGKIGDGTDDDGDCGDCAFNDEECKIACREEDSIGENNGVPDCNEPNVDNYNEFLSNIHISPDEDGNNGCIVSMINMNTDYTCHFTFKDSAGSFFDTRYNGGNRNNLIDDFYTVPYGAYVPDSTCSESMWTNIYGGIKSKYNFTADCSAAGFGVVTSKEPITISEPVVFVDYIQNSISTNPETPADISEYLENLSIRDCTDYNCLESGKIQAEDQDGFIYFPRYSQFSSILWATISPNVYFQATQYMDNSIYYHGHPSVGTDFLNIIGSVCLMGETVVSDFYDGYGNEEYNKGEIFIDSGDFNGEYDEGETFIDTGDGYGEIDTYYYEISTFSESYKNYYYYSQLLPNDPERSNLQDENMNPIMGAFGSITTNRIDYKIIDCTAEDLLDDELSCNDILKTKGVCSWYDAEEFVDGNENDIYDIGEIFYDFGADKLPNTNDQGENNGFWNPSPTLSLIDPEGNSIEAACLPINWSF
jgi:hypothetical protein